MRLKNQTKPTTCNHSLWSNCHLLAFNKDRILMAGMDNQCRTYLCNPMLSLRINNHKWWWCLLCIIFLNNIKIPICFITNKVSHHFRWLANRFWTNPDLMVATCSRITAITIIILIITMKMAIKILIMKI